MKRTISSIFLISTFLWVTLSAINEKKSLNHYHYIGGTTIGAASGALSYFLLNRLGQTNTSTKALISGFLGLGAMGCSLSVFKYLLSLPVSTQDGSAFSKRKNTNTSINDGLRVFPRASEEQQNSLKNATSVNELFSTVVARQTADSSPPLQEYEHAFAHRSYTFITSKEQQDLLLLTALSDITVDNALLLSGKGHYYVIRHLLEDKEINECITALHSYIPDQYLVILDKAIEEISQNALDQNDSILYSDHKKLKNAILSNIKSVSDQYNTLLERLSSFKELCKLHEIASTAENYNQLCLESNNTLEDIFYTAYPGCSQKEDQLRKKYCMSGSEVDELIKNNQQKTLIIFECCHDKTSNNHLVIELEKSIIIFEHYPDIAGYDLMAIDTFIRLLSKNSTELMHIHANNQTQGFLGIQSKLITNNHAQFVFITRIIIIDQVISAYKKLDNYPDKQREEHKRALNGIIFEKIPMKEMIQFQKRIVSNRYYDLTNYSNFYHNLGNYISEIATNVITYIDRIGRVVPEKPKKGKFKVASVNK